MLAVFGDDDRGGRRAVRVRDLDFVVPFGGAGDEGDPGAVRGPDRFLEGSPLVKWVTCTARLIPSPAASGSIT